MTFGKAYIEVYLFRLIVSVLIFVGVATYILIKNRR